MIPNDFFQEIKGYKQIYLSVSGGMDSTYSALQFYERGIPITLIHNNTMNRMKSSANTLKKLVEFTNYPYIETKPTVKFKDIIKESFLAIQNAKDLKESGKYSKKVFACCYHLKHKPFQFFSKLPLRIV